MKIIIENKAVAKEQLDAFKLEHALKAFSNLKLPVPSYQNVDELCEKLTDAKLKLSDDEIRRRLKSKLKKTVMLTNFVLLFSNKKRRKTSLTTIYADGIKVEKLKKVIENLMLFPSVQNKKVNLSAFPEHYLLTPKNGVLEVIETTGNAPWPSQFFITFNDETGIKEPRNSQYPYQSVGVAKSKKGVIIGGVRHQFRNTPTGIEARLLVEFPSRCPTSLVKEHQKHLAVEWSHWIEYARKIQLK